LETLKEEDQLEDIDIDGKILERILCDGDGLDSSQNRNSSQVNARIDIPTPTLPMLSGLQRLGVGMAC
jgi:hypothetical protein